MPGVNCAVSTMGYSACSLSIENSSAAAATAAAATTAAAAAADADAAAADTAVADIIAAAVLCKIYKNTCYSMSDDNNGITLPCHPAAGETP